MHRIDARVWDRKTMRNSMSQTFNFYKTWQGSKSDPILARNGSFRVLFGLCQVF